jgi:hypothetical protein
MMNDLLKKIDFEGGIVLHELIAWMDGGSITLSLTDTNQTVFDVTICQSVDLEIHDNTDKWIPGSLLFNNTEVPIRSNSERMLLTALKSLQFSDKIPRRNRALERELIRSRIAFVESDEYLKIASRMGRFIV